MVPRQISETFRPVRPRRTVFMMSPLINMSDIRRRDYRERLHSWTPFGFLRPATQLPIGRWVARILKNPGKSGVFWAVTHQRGREGGRLRISQPTLTK